MYLFSLSLSIYICERERERRLADPALGIARKTLNLKLSNPNLPTLKP